MTRDFLYAGGKAPLRERRRARSRASGHGRRGREGYGRRCARLLDELRSSGGAGGPFALRKDTSNLFRDRQRDARRRLDLRRFNHVTAIDAEAGWVEAEGTTTYEDLVAATLAHGVLPAVVPELKTITLGGAAAGVGIEASSFRHGLVHESLLELDVLTGDGKVLTCRPDNEHADLFFGFPTRMARSAMRSG
jgi:FAD/FMN-containing dehydrogenase